MGGVFILGGARTPFAVWAGGKRPDGSAGGALRDLDPFELGAAALRGALERSGLPASRLDALVFGNMYHVGAHACYGGRYVGWRAGVPDRVPALTVSMACASGLCALIAAARELESGRAAAAAAAGADNVSLLRRDVFVPSFRDLSCGQPIGLTAQTLAGEYGLSRREQDRWALRSHELALRARKEGRLAAEIVEAGGVREDDAVMPAPSGEAFARAPGAHDKEKGSVTRLNSHALVDGGSALLLGGEALAQETRRPPLGRFVAGAWAAVPPERMAYASVPAVRGLLERASLSAGDVDLFEINETFAAQVLVDLKELGIPEEKVNVNGGAIALGHPFAATGARQVLALLLELKRRGLKRGVASICAGGGQAAAVLVEAV